MSFTLFLICYVMRIGVRNDIFMILYFIDETLKI